MYINDIVPIGTNEYVVKKIEQLNTLSRFAYVGSKAYCKENGKVYIQINVGEWVSM